MKISDRVKSARLAMKSRQARCEINAAKDVRENFRRQFRRDPVYNDKQIIQLVKTAGRTTFGYGMRFRANRVEDSIAVSPAFGDEPQRFRTHHTDNENLVPSYYPRPRTVSYSPQAAWDDDDARLPRCPCTSADQVAIDALMEGNKADRAKAERIAVACFSGGGVLEGMKKRRRK